MNSETDKSSDRRRFIDSNRRVKVVRIVSELATVMCVLMYVSYISEIQSNLAGNPVSLSQPLTMMLDAILWTGYGWLKKYRDWPLIISNVPGVLFGVVTILTIYVH
ncbi:SemiSWEET family transporter [Weissella bombi]|uniref:Sugar efflux transporter for intercellular exchange n=1 Tax=Weissella bombi TaxID=1505725 RepID=A0A1C3YRQ2_9LACO|nr:SemiSWEET family transporter [Weissella bombi]SCB72708.1 Sugar efflux transporter for intercellular exchange [Weissella bombi]